MRLAASERPAAVQLGQSLQKQVAELRAKDPKGYEKKNAAKRLAVIISLAFDVISQDPARPEYRQGNTLSAENRHWFRAKFFQQYRLFFRFHAPSTTIVLGWVNDEAIKRAYDSDGDAYRMFGRMLASGHPPSDWEPLLADARAQGARLRGLVGDVPS